jgi:hypothetical protein
MATGSRDGENQEAGDRGNKQMVNAWNEGERNQGNKRTRMPLFTAHIEITSGSVGGFISGAEANRQLIP